MIVQASPAALILGALIVVNIVLIGALRLHPDMTARASGRVLAFVALFLLPVVTFSGSTAHHLEKAKTTEFCLSCHVMEPYGRSLRIDSADYVPAAHAQNNRVPRDQACYTCHTSYAMFGDLRAKLNGLRHVYVNYLGSIPEPIELYGSFRNGECLHCHADARSFENNSFHADLRQEIRTNEVSCLDCHSMVHAVEELDELPLWNPAEMATGGSDR